MRGNSVQSLKVSDGGPSLKLSRGLARGEAVASLWITSGFGRGGPTRFYGDPESAPKERSWANVTVDQ